MDSVQLNRFVIEPALRHLDLLSETGINLILGTCAVESDMGRYIKQINGPALGIYQMEPNTHHDLLQKYVHDSRFEDVFSSLKPAHGNWLRCLKYDLYYQTIMTRLHYFRVPEALPSNTPEGLASYWKKYYNTEAGKGTEEKFMEAYDRYVT